MLRQPANRQNSQEAAAVAAAAATVPGRYPMPTGVDKLTGLENWAVWKYLITLHLSGNRLIQCINERTSDEEMADPDGEAAVKDKAVQQAIAYNLHTNLIQLVAQTTTAYDAWATLCGTFENQGVQRRLTLINKLFDLRRSDYSSLEKYVLDVKEVVAQVQSAGIALDDEIAAANVLRNLRPEDSIMRRFVESSSTKPDAQGKPVLNFAAVIQELLREARVAAEELVAKTALKVSIPESKPAQSYGGRGRGRGARRGRGGRGRGGRRGHHHHQSDRLEYSQQSNQNYSGSYPPCRNCSKTNHSEDYCYYKNMTKKRRTERDEQAQHSKEPRREPRRDSVVRFDSHSGGRSHQHSQGPKGGWVLKVAKRPGDACSSASSKVCKLGEDHSVVEIYIDSGASDNMCGIKNYLNDYKETSWVPIECAGDQMLSIIGQGVLKINSARHNGLHEIQNMKYVPGLSSMLLSVSSMTKCGHAVVFVDNHCGIYNKKDIIINGEPLLKTEEKYGTYKLNLEVKNTRSAFKSQSKAYVPWHERLGHLGKNNLSLMAAGLVEGMGETHLDKAICEPCIRAKQTRAPLPKGGADRANEILELIHSDVCEVTDGLSREGFRYFVTFIDDKTRYTTVGFLKTKSEVFEKFKQFKILVEKHTGKFIKYLRSDNGGEYINRYFAQYFKEQGILNQFTVSDTPEQDGVAERANRTLMEKVRAMLKTCGLDIKFWPLALSTAIYLKNISPTKAVQGMVPMEAWTGSKPHIGHLRVFGCLAYAHIDKNKTKKLMDRTKACIFVGYDDERKGFKLLDPNSNAVFTHRSVIFNENSFPALRNTQGNERSVDSINYVPGAIIPVAVYPGDATSNPGCSNSAIPEGGDPSDSSTGQNDLRAKTGGVASGGAISNPGCSIRQIPDGENLSTGPAQSETPSLWGAYSDTSISRVSGDQVSMSELDSSISRSESGVSTEIDVETINTENAPQLSPSKRLSVPPKHLDDFVLYDRRGEVNSGCKFARLAIPTSRSVPVTVQEAVDSPEASFWLKAMEDELNSFESNRVWSLEAPANGAQVVGNKWVFKKKVDFDGSTLYRARLVAKGYTQTYGVDYFETFAPVVRRETLRILFSVAVNFNLKIAHLDVKTAFLHGDLKENVFMSQPDGFMIPGSEHLVCRLHKAVYGLKQAARSWNLKADQILKGEGFRNLPDEPCIYLKNPVNSVIIVALYVDDFYIFYRQESDKSKLLKALQTCVTIKDLGEARSCLGMEIVRNSDGSILLKQEEYIESILARFSMKDCKGAHTPMEFKLKLGHLPTGGQRQEQALRLQETTGQGLHPRRSHQLRPFVNRLNAS
ncbi:hypothetical protein ONE63_001645 [Megalurothrips usitatus]|uniref:Integrase catalytic domain-containing protein n=1 Tax=Megalurothrips usitatus TaxID=439358 RepID=A0AAV7XD57_9NEOP|nr:hypothetical protein ONE63_001645 [Megalurothrips usitatus]